MTQRDHLVVRKIGVKGWEYHHRLISCLQFLLISPFLLRCVLYNSPSIGPKKFKPMHCACNSHLSLYLVKEPLEESLSK